MAIRVIVLMVALGTVARAQLADPDTEAARRHYLRGDEEYQAGHYETALREFEQGRAIKPLPAFDFDIARCLDRLERWREAADAYERYLAIAPDVQDAAELRERARALRARAASMSPQPVGPGLVPGRLVAKPVDRPPRTAYRPAAIAMGAVTVTLGAIGGGLLGSVESGFRDLQADCRQRACGPADWASLESRADAGYALLGLAGAAMIVDVALAVRAAKHP
jgi:tetratricopeptide (TPR) repeat protein